MPHLFSHIMVRAEQDILNWILNEFSRFTLKLVRTFFLDPEVPYGWGKFIWSSYLLPSKTLVLWKLFMGGFLQINIFKIKVCIFVLCVRFVKSTRNLFSIYFFECSNALRIWSWVRHIFPTSHFPNKDDLLSFIKSDGSLLVKTD